MAFDGAEQFCYVTTTGRRSGEPHTIEIWFAARGTTIYLMSGGREQADWVRNMRADGRVGVRIGDRWYEGTARVLTPGDEEDAVARRMLLEKYQTPGADDLESWGRSALPVAIGLDKVGG